MAERTNILLITSDQQHWSLLGRHRPGLRTPNLDRLADEGTLFSRAYCPNPTCSPTRSSIITGLYPSQHGCYTLGTKLPESVPTLGGMLREARPEYEVSLVGKAHFQPLKSTPQCVSEESYPLLQDLEYWRNRRGPFYGFEPAELARNHTDEAHVGQHYALWLQQRVGDTWKDWFQPPTGRTPAQKHRWNIPEEHHYNAWITERSIARLDAARDADRPFVLWASYFDPHPSYLVPEPWASMYDPADIELPEVKDDVSRWPELMRRTRDPAGRFADWKEPAGAGIHGAHPHTHTPDELRRDTAVYYGMMSMLDAYIGRLLDRLEANGQARNTLVVFTSDHGHYFGQHGLVAKGPFHFEDGVRVPLIVRWPGRVPAGRVSESLQTLVDFTPTFLDAAGVEPSAHMTGVSQLPVWCGDAPGHDAVFVENRHQPTTLNLRTYIDRRYKLTIWLDAVGTDEGELYDLETDPGESTNLWHDPTATDLKARLLLRMAQAEMTREPYRGPRASGA